MLRMARVSRRFAPSVQLLQWWMSKRKDDEEQVHSAFNIYYKHEGDPEYPFLLALAIQKSETQVETARAMKMLGDWMCEYQQMSEVIKYKYSPYIGKIQKILVGKFAERTPVEYCVSRFFLCFYRVWKEFTETLVALLKESDTYALSFLWYTCHNLLYEANSDKMQHLMEFLTAHFQDPLRFFDPETEADARKILEIVYFINIYGCRQDFAGNASKWALKMRLFQGAGSQEIRIGLLMMIIRNRNLLLCEQKSRTYWMLKVSDLFDYLQKKMPQMYMENVLDREVLDLFQWAVELQDTKELLLGSDGRYLKSLLTSARPNPTNPNYIFNDPKYSHLISMLYAQFFELDNTRTRNRMKQILEKFTSHAFSILNDEKNYTFLQCYAEKEISIEPAMVNDILKLLSSTHIRRTLTTKVLIVLAKLIEATLNSCPFSDETVGMCLRAFSESLIQKAIDPLIVQLRLMVARLFLHLMQMYVWEDNIKSEYVFVLCDDFQKNSKTTSPLVISLLALLVKKFGFANQSLHKLQPLISDIHVKIIYDEVNMHEFISLLIVIYFSAKWEKAIGLIESVCSKNKSPLAPFYSFQAQTLIKSNSHSSETEMKVVAEILESRENWYNARIKVNLILLQMYFLRLNSTEAFKVLRMVDAKILQLIRQLYQEGNYRLLCELTAKTLPAAGGAVNLQRLQSYAWVRKFSFQILARSFHKSTSIYVCYIFSNIILRADHQAITVKWLSQEQFLDYLYQGLNDFLSKEKKITLELATTILLFKIFKIDPSALPAESHIPDFTTVAKNVGWWADTGEQISFQLLQQDKTSILLPEFKNFYEEAVLGYFKDYEKAYRERKQQRQSEMESLAHNDDDI